MIIVANTDSMSTLCQAHLYVSTHLFSQQFCEVGVKIPILQMRKQA